MVLGVPPRCEYDLVLIGGPGDGEVYSHHSPVGEFYYRPRSEAELIDGQLGDLYLYFLEGHQLVGLWERRDA